MVRSPSRNLSEAPPPPPEAETPSDAAPEPRWCMPSWPASRGQRALFWSICGLLLVVQVAGTVLAARQAGSSVGTAPAEHRRLPKPSRSAADHPASSTIAAEAVLPATAPPAPAAPPPAAVRPSAIPLQPELEQLRAALDAAQAGASVDYIVQPGEGLSSIAAQFGISEPELAAANGLEPTAWLLIGQVLRLPVAVPTIRLAR